MSRTKGTFSRNLSATGNAERQQQFTGYADALRTTNPTLLGPSGLSIPDLAQSVKGIMPTRNEYITPRQKNALYGVGTFANANQGFFRTKKSVPVEPEVAKLLNSIYESYMTGINTDTFDEWSNGLSGKFDGMSYNFSVQSYPENWDVRITFPDSEVLGVEVPLALPGSTVSSIAAAQGYANGLASIKSPLTSGYQRVGGPEWRKLLTAYSAKTPETAMLPAAVMDQWLALSLIFGLGHAFARNNINVTQNPDGSFRLEPFDNPGAQLHANNVLQFAPALLTTIKNFYEENAVNPDQRRTGDYAGFDLYGRNTDKLILPAASALGRQVGLSADVNGSQSPENAAMIAEALSMWWADNGTLSGAGIKWAPGYKVNRQRLGMTAHPMINKTTGQPLTGMVTNQAQGACDIRAGGPGLGQNARLGGQAGFNFATKKRNHKNVKGQVTAPPTYNCGFYPDYMVNPDSARFKKGGRYAPLEDLSTALTNIDNDVHYGITDDYLRANYVDWATHPEEYGTDPNFMLDPADGRLGFSRAAPLIRRTKLNAAQQKEYDTVNLNRQWLAERSAGLVNGQVGTFGQQAGRGLRGGGITKLQQQQQLQQQAQSGGV